MYDQNAKTLEYAIIIKDNKKQCNNNEIALFYYMLELPAGCGSHRMTGSTLL